MRIRSIAQSSFAFGDTMPTYSWTRGESVPRSARATTDDLLQKVAQAVRAADCAYAKLHQARGLLDDLRLLPCWLAFKFQSPTHSLTSPPLTDESIVVPFWVDREGGGITTHAMDLLPPEFQAFLEVPIPDGSSTNEVYCVLDRESAHVECLLVHVQTRLGEIEQHARLDCEQHAVFHFLLSLRQTIKAQTLKQTIRLNRFTTAFERTPLDEEHASGFLLDEAIAVTGAPGGCIWYLPDARHGVKLLSCKGLPDLHADNLQSLEAECSTPIRDWLCAPNGCHSRVVSATSTDRARDLLPPQLRNGSAILAPLVVRNKSLGLLCLFSSEPHRFTPFDLLSAETVTASCGSTFGGFVRVSQLRAVQEGFSQVLAAPQDQEKWLEDLHEHFADDLGCNVDFLALQLLNEQTDTIETVAARGNRARPWNLIARHHISSCDIHADIFAHPRVAVIRSADEHFDPLLFRPHHHDSLERLFVPLFSSTEAASPNLSAPRHIERLDRNRTEWDLSACAGAIVGTLEIGVDIEKETPSFFTPQLTERICRHVWSQQDTIQSWSLRAALQTTIQALQTVSGATHATLTYPSASGERTLSAHSPSSSSPSTDSASPRKMDITVGERPWGKVELWPITTDHSIEMHVVGLLVVEIGHFLSALRQERAARDLNAFLLAVFNAVAWLHSARDPDIFLQMIAATAMHFLLAESIDLQIVSESAVMSSRLSRAKPWLDDKTEPVPLQSIPKPAGLQSDNLIHIEIGDGRLIPNPIDITQHYVPNHYYPRQYYRNLKTVLKFHVRNALQTFYDDRRREKIWLAGLASVNAIRGTDKAALFRATRSVLSSVIANYLGCAFIGYDDAEGEFFLSEMDIPALVFQSPPSSHPSRVKARTIPADSRTRMYYNSSDPYFINHIQRRQGVHPEPLSTFDFKGDIELVAVVPRRPQTPPSDNPPDRRSDRADHPGTSLHHIIIVLQGSTDKPLLDADTTRQLGTFAGLLQSRLRELEAEKASEIAREAERIVSGTDSTPSFLKALEDILLKIHEVEDFGLYELDSSSNWRRMASHPSTLFFSGSLDTSLAPVLNSASEHEEHSVRLQQPTSDSSGPSAWHVLARRVGSHGGKTWVLAIAARGDQAVGLTPFHREVLLRIVAVFKRAVDRIYELDVMKFQAAQVAHAAKSHLAGLADDADLLRLRLQTPDSYLDVDLVGLCNSMVQRVDEARIQVLATLNKTDTLERRLLNVREVTEVIVASFSSTAKTRGIRVDVEDSIDRLPHVRIAEGQLDIILRNLVENAIKYSWDDRLVRIFAAEQVPNRWCIQNFGEGIPEEYRNQVFWAGFRGVPRRRRPDAGGLGMGLQTAKGIADSLQIEIDFRSTFKGNSSLDEREGRCYLTTFWITFPSTLIVA